VEGKKTVREGVLSRKGGSTPTDGAHNSSLAQKHRLVVDVQVDAVLQAVLRSLLRSRHLFEGG
jgi:hypothetical protein